MRPVIATGIFGTLGIALALEVMSVVTTFTTMQHLATYSGTIDVCVFWNSGKNCALRQWLGLNRHSPVAGGKHPIPPRYSLSGRIAVNGAVTQASSE